MINIPNVHLNSFFSYSLKFSPTYSTFIMMILTFLVFLPIILIYFLQKHKMPAKTLVPPGPPALPLIGKLHQLATAKVLHVYLWQLSKKYGPIIQMKLGSTPLIIISSPKLAKEVMRTQDLANCSRPRLLGQQKLAYNGKDVVFSPYNSYWKEVRRVISSQLFSVKKIQSFRPIREDKVSRLIEKISSISSSNQVVNLNEVAIALASTLICRTAFRKRYDKGGSDIRRFNELLRDAQVISAAFFISDYIPTFSWMDKLNGLINRVEKTCKNLDSFYQELIDEHLDPNREKELDDILDVLIKLKEEKSFAIDFTWDHIKALLMDIFIAGTDTSASSIVWIMTSLMKAPNVTKKLQSEIRNLIGEKGKVDEHDLPKLPYLKATICEFFRLYPPVPILLPRETMETSILEGYEIQPKTVVYVNAWAIARDPEYWENQDEFLPERFLNNNIDIKGQDFGVIPFGSGRRSCPGMIMGLLSVELIIANLLYSFDWELPLGIHARDVDTDTLPGVVMRKKNELILVPKKYVI